MYAICCCLYYGLDFGIGGFSFDLALWITYYVSSKCLL